MFRGAEPKEALLHSAQASRTWRHAAARAAQNQTLRATLSARFYDRARIFHVKHVEHGFRLEISVCQTLSAL